MTRPKNEGKAGAPADTPVADARAENWADRYAPAWALPYLRLARADRPVGFYLLALPCFWSVGLAGIHSSAAYPDPVLLLLFAVGAIVMRGAGCTYNDIVDRDIDAKVARTRSRPLPSGQVSLTSAVAFMLAQCLVGLGVLLSLNTFSIWLGFAVIPIVALYPFMKRISHWPQAVLGLAFNWGALMGWAAVTGRLDWAPVVLYVGAVAWTVGYDTIYAHQDREDDALIGMKSTALRFGADTRYWLSGFYAVTIAAMGLAGWLSGGGPLFFAGLAFACGQILWQIATLDIDDADNCLARFKSNRDFGLIVFFAILADMTLVSSL
ncbi:4-hydroxybenzoate octaprenyltransferase [Methyloceanibacter caenitepidi]|uniref:4-hydroxybenzoate octaprenyltransferase n=1 Tax=Methyloceanibacter caenitepidi TaxID=1384459 RepID=A0A0A8K0L6_9HYPH|nr:4-hydroxybenzoate octaprenyltransferase [Methyloceanibacter caenitepidi]BAQ16435.1 4-hydroxybenzoate polyprenyltransferase [Methyloceanibacter caenitepidi]